MSAAVAGSSALEEADAAEGKSLLELYMLGKTRTDAIYQTTW